MNKKTLIVIDVETDGPLQGINSMVCFGGVIVDKTLDKTFYGKTKPISEIFDEKSLSISNFSREEHENFDDPKIVMQNFKNWISDNVDGIPVLISDNNGFDASWINWYFHYFLGENQFGHSSKRIGDIYNGFTNKINSDWKKYRVTEHNHNPLDDAKGNAEAILKMMELGVRFI